MTLPTPVAAIVADYLSIVDEEAPGLVDGLYLVGSVALNDFRPGVSDIDVVAVTSRPADAAAVRRVHSRLSKQYRRPPLNGPYVTWAELAADPRSAAPGIHVRGNGVVAARAMAGRDPVTWHTLAQAGIAVRGPDLGTIDLWTDRAGLAASVRENLNSYWRHWHRVATMLPLSVKGLATLIDWGPAWCVLGVSRLHYTLATGKITSKSGAGDYARETFPARWHQIVDECLRIRRQRPEPSRYRSRLARRRAALSFVDYVIADVG